MGTLSLDLSIALTKIFSELHYSPRFFFFPTLLAEVLILNCDLNALLLSFVSPHQMNSYASNSLGHLPEDLTQIQSHWSTFIFLCWYHIAISRLCSLFWCFNVDFWFCFLAALGLHCCAGFFSSCGEQGRLFIAVLRLLIAMASLVAEQRL